MRVTGERKRILLRSTMQIPAICSRDAGGSHGDPAHLSGWTRGESHAAGRRGGGGEDYLASIAIRVRASSWTVDAYAYAPWLIAYRVPVYMRVRFLNRCGALSPDVQKRPTAGSSQPSFDPAIPPARLCSRRSESRGTGRDGTWKVSGQLPPRCSVSMLGDVCGLQIIHGLQDRHCIHHYRLRESI